MTPGHESLSVESSSARGKFNKMQETTATDKGTPARVEDQTREPDTQQLRGSGQSRTGERQVRNNHGNHDLVDYTNINFAY